MTTQCEESRARRRTRTLQPKSAEEEKGAGAERGERVGRREESGASLSGESADSLSTFRLLLFLDMIFLKSIFSYAISALSEA